jgi:hypothetical protein
MTVAEEAPPSDMPRRRRVQVRLGAVIAVALVAGFLVWLLVVNDDDDDGNGDSATTADATAARSASPEELSELAQSLEYPIYWAGALPDHTYELTRSRSGRVYIRYLPEGVEVGNRDPRYLTIGTYPQANGYAAVRAASRRPNTISRETRGGALVVFDRTHPRSTYFSFPGARFQVEVFDPEPGRARRLTLAGRIVRVR